MRNCLLILAVAWVSLGGLAILPAGAGEGDSAKKAPVPDAESQKKTAGIVRDLYRKEYDAAKTPQQKAAFARRMLDEGRQTTDDPVGRYVLFRVARDMAVQAGDLETLLAALEALGQHYSVECGPMLADALEKAAAGQPSAEECKLLADAALTGLERATSGNEHEAASRLAKVATTMAQRSRDKGLIGRAAEATQRMTKIVGASAGVAQAQAALEKDPTNGDANFTVGRFQCLVRNDWESGLPMLALGSNADFQAAATDDLADPKSADAQVKVGDRWWDLAEKLSDPREQQVVRQRAATWYERGVAGVEGLNKRRVEKRLESLLAAAKPAAESPSTAAPEANAAGKPPAALPGKFDKLKKNVMVPGVVIRVYYDSSYRGPRPTHAVAVVQSCSEYREWVLARARALIERNGSSYGDSYYSFRVAGFVAVKRAGTVKIEMTNCRCLLDGRMMTPSQSANSVEVKLPRGNHPVTFEPSSDYADSVDFKVTDLQTGESLLCYSKELLTAQMSLPGVGRYSDRERFPPVLMAKDLQAP